MSVEYNRNIYRMKINDDMYSLDLSGLQIDDITAIKGLEELTEILISSSDIEALEKYYG